MSSNNVKRSSDAVTAGGHGDISLLPELEAFRDPKSKAARASYDDADIYRDEKSFNEHTLAPMFTTSRAYFVFVIALGIVIANGFAWFVAQTFLGMGQTNMHEPRSFSGWACHTLERLFLQFYGSHKQTGEDQFYVLQKP